ncbi:hypothetical protein WR25_09001 [Diploscapter pachys]|uniref:Uncharacterized protein n=1 Tax=Diploscapter pachys TaxID=2018661 RepID=A0A2A2M1H6_9BILA|nr:hypothetical protein WR25_09001 [Diploscapter pachys]
MPSGAERFEYPPTYGNWIASLITDEIIIPLNYQELDQKPLNHSSNSVSASESSVEVSPSESLNIKHEIPRVRINPNPQIKRRSRIDSEEEMNLAIHSMTLPRHIGLVHPSSSPRRWDHHPPPYMHQPEMSATLGRTQYGQMMHDDRRYATMESRAPRRYANSQSFFYEHQPNGDYDFQAIGPPLARSLSRSQVRLVFLFTGSENEVG